MVGGQDAVGRRSMRGIEWAPPWHSTGEWARQPRGLQVASTSRRCVTREANCLYLLNIKLVQPACFVVCGQDDVVFDE
jgi:hypothetical protein